MNRFVVAVAIVAIAVAGLALTPHAALANVEQEDMSATCPPEQALVKVNPGADPVEVVARHGGTILKTITGIDVQVVAVPAGTLQQKLDELNADPDVKYAEANGVVRATQNAAGQECPPASASTTP